jgi:hypothetical protein
MINLTFSAEDVAYPVDDMRKMDDSMHRDILPVGGIE